MPFFGDQLSDQAKTFYSFHTFTDYHMVFWFTAFIERATFSSQSRTEIGKL